MSPADFSIRADLDAAFAALSTAFFSSAFTVGGASVPWLEVVAFVMAVTMVVLNMRVDARAWPLAIGSSLLYFALFWKNRLYGDAALQLVFAGVAVWGWRQWLRDGDSGGEGRRAALHVRSLSRRGRLLCLAAIALAWPATGAFLAAFTDSDVPWWDAFPTAASLVGQWLLGRKYVDNWPTWLAVNIVAVALFAHKGLWLTVVLYGLFAVLSVVGWRAWLRLAPAVPPVPPVAAIPAHPGAPS